MMRLDGVLYLTCFLGLTILTFGSFWGIYFFGGGVPDWMIYAKTVLVELSSLEVVTPVKYVGSLALGVLKFVGTVIYIIASIIYIVIPPYLLILTARLALDTITLLAYGRFFAIDGLPRPYNRIFGLVDPREPA